MKHIEKYIAIAGASLMLSACNDSFFDINDDPNNPTSATSALILPAAEGRTAFVFGGYYQNLGGFWSQHYAQSPAASQWAVLESYNLTSDDFNRQWTSLYAGSLYDFKVIREQAAASSDWSHYAIAALLQDYTFAVLADLYDQVPYSEALQGAANLQPKYDKGSDIYPQLIADIDDILSKDFTLSSCADAKTDQFYAGDMDAWVAFGKTLKLKLCLRYVNVDATKYAEDIKALLADGDFLTEDLAFSSYSNAKGYYNPFYATFLDRLSGNVSANTTFLGYLEENEDPRIPKIFKGTEKDATKYVGLATGTNKDYSDQSYKDYSTPAITSTSSSYLMTSEESLFLQAEAQLRYGTASEAESLYKSGIENSLSRYGLASDAVTYAYDGLKSIMVQKWVALANMNALECFFDYNRTGYPDFFTASSTSVLNGSSRPKRLLFVAGERQSNANAPELVSIDTPVWWAK